MSFEQPSHSQFGEHPITTADQLRQELGNLPEIITEENGGREKKVKKETICNAVEEVLSLLEGGRNLKEGIVRKTLNKIPDEIKKIVTEALKTIVEGGEGSSISFPEAQSPEVASIHWLQNTNLAEAMRAAGEDVGMLQAIVGEYTLHKQIIEEHPQQDAKQQRIFVNICDSRIAQIGQKIAEIEQKNKQLSPDYSKVTTKEGLLVAINNERIEKAVEEIFAFVDAHIKEDEKATSESVREKLEQIPAEPGLRNAVMQLVHERITAAEKKATQKIEQEVVLKDGTKTKENNHFTRAITVGELLGLLEKTDSIVGSQKTYSSQEIIAKFKNQVSTIRNLNKEATLEQVKNTIDSWMNSYTKTGGLKEAVQNILIEIAEETIDKNALATATIPQPSPEQSQQKKEQQAPEKIKRIVLKDNTTITENDYFNRIDTAAGLLSSLEKINSIVGSEKTYSAKEIKKQFSTQLKALGKIDQNATLEQAQRVINAWLPSYPHAGGLREVVEIIFTNSAKSIIDKNALAKIQETQKEQTENEIKAQQQEKPGEPQQEQEVQPPPLPVEPPPLPTQPPPLPQVDRSEELLQEKLSQLNFTPEELEKMGEIGPFTKLTPEQKILALQNLEQAVLEKVKSEGTHRFEESLKKKGFLGKIWSGVRKNYLIAKNEKEALEEATQHVFNVIDKEQFAQITRQVSMLPVDVTEGGEIQISFARVGNTANNEFTFLNSNELQEVNAFNQIANAYAQTPQEWRYETASPEQRKQYKKIEMAYRSARERLVGLKLKELKEQFGDNEKNSIATELYIHKVDAQVAMQQFLQTHPDARDELEKLRESSTLWRTIKGMASEKTIPFLTGAGIRQGIPAAVLKGGIFGSTGAVLSFLSAPLAGGVVGGFLANRRVNEQLKKEELEGRKGSENRLELTTQLSQVNSKIDVYMQETKKRALTRDELDALHVLVGQKEVITERIKRIPQKKENETRKEITKKISEINWQIVNIRRSRTLSEEEKDRLIQKSEEEIKNLEEKRNKIPQETAKNLAPATFLTTKLCHLIDKFNSTSNEFEKIKILQSLRVRVEYTEDKVSEGLVSYGKDHAAIANQAELAQAICHAQSLVSIEEHRFEEFYETIKKQLGGFILPKNQQQFFIKGKATIKDDPLSWIAHRENYLRNNLHDLLSEREARIETTRKEYKWKQIRKGIVMGATFGAAGYLARHAAGEVAHYLQGDNSSGPLSTVQEATDETIPPTEKSSIAQPIPATTPQQEATPSPTPSPITIESPSPQPSPTAALEQIQTPSPTPETTPSPQSTPENMGDLTEISSTTPSSSQSPEIPPTDDINEIDTIESNPSEQNRGLGYGMTEEDMAQTPLTENETVTPESTPSQPLQETPSSAETTPSPKQVSEIEVVDKTVRGKKIYGNQEQILKNYYIGKGMSSIKAGRLANQFIESHQEEGLKTVHAGDKVQIFENENGEVAEIKVIPKNEAIAKQIEASSSETKDIIHDYKVRGKIVHDSAEHSVLQLIKKNPRAFGYDPDGDIPPTKWAKARVDEFFSKPENKNLREIVTHDGNEVVVGQDAEGNLTVRVEQGSGRNPKIIDKPQATEQIQSKGESTIEEPPLPQKDPINPPLAKIPNDTTETSLMDEMPLFSEKSPELTPVNINELPGQEKLLRLKLPLDANGHLETEKLTIDQQKTFESLAHQAEVETETTPTEENMGSLDTPSTSIEVDPTFDLNMIATKGIFNETAYKEMLRVHRKNYPQLNDIKIFDGVERANIELLKDKEGHMWIRGKTTTYRGDDPYMGAKETTAIRGERGRSSSGFKFAARWPYKYMPKNILLKETLVKLRCPRTGETCYAYPDDWGPSPIAIKGFKNGKPILDFGKDGKTPNYWDRAFDSSKAVMKKLRAQDKDELEVTLVRKENFEIDRKGNLVEKVAKTAKKAVKTARR